MKEKLIFSCNWGKEPEKAWSGTSMALYRELMKYYDVEKFHTNPMKSPLFGFRFLEKMGIARFDLLYTRYFTNVYKRKYKGKKQSVFQFDECPNCTQTDAYVFQDLCIAFLIDVYENHKELIPYCGLENLNVQYLKKRLPIQTEFYKNAKGIFTMGQWLADYLVEQCGIPSEKVHAVGGGINVDQSKIKNLPKKGNKVLFVGRDFVRKGGDLTVEAFQLLKKKRKDVELYIAGPKQNPIPEEQMTDGIHFLGEQNKEQLSELYNMCDVFCLPSRFEAYGLVFAEALTYGLPCIARNAFAMKDFITDGENGYLLQNDDIQELALKMEMSLDNEEMKQFVRSQRQHYLETYSWERIGKAIKEYIK